MSLRIEEREFNGVTVLELAGRITLGDESSRIRTKIKELLEKGKTRLVLDMANVTHIDSMGLGTLVSGYTSAHTQGATLKLANLTKNFSELLSITKLLTIFDVYDSVADAVKSFEQPA